MPIPDFGLVALREQRLRQAEDRLAVGPDVWPDLGADGPLVFTDQVGRPVDPGEVSKWLHRLLGAAGLPDMRFHDLRHAFATLALASGTDLKTVSEMLGHSTITITADTYAHVLPKAKADTARRMDTLLTG